MSLCIYTKNDIIMNIIINASLHMSLGKLCGQIGHIVHTITDEIIKKHITYTEQYDRYIQWKDSGCKINIFTLSEKYMNDFIKINYSEMRYIKDAGKTQIASGSLTIIGFFPNSNKNIMDIFDKCDKIPNIQHVCNIILHISNNINIKNEIISYKKSSIPEMTMYICVNNDIVYKLDKYIIIQNIVNITQFVINRILLSASNKKNVPDYFVRYTHWNKNGAKKVVLNVSQKQLEEMILLEESNYLTLDDNIIIVIFFPSCTLKTLFNTYKLL